MVISISTTNKIKLQLITQVPNVDYRNGNLADNTLVADVCKTNKTICFRPFHDLELLKNKFNIRIPIKEEVFTKGEIIIIDNKTLREIGGKYRCADKWSVNYLLFDLKDIDKAIKLSKKLSN